METLDIFTGDAWKVIAMTTAINRLPFIPGRAGRLGIFSEQGVTQTTIQIEEQSGQLALIPAKLRGDIPNQNAHSKRLMRAFNIPHLPLEDHVEATEVQGVRAFDSTELQTVEGVRDARLAQMVTKHDLTLEYGRVGAIKGVIYDADGQTVIYNLFNEFGVVQQTQDMTLGTATTKIRAKLMATKRQIELELGAATYDHIHVFCGAAFFDALTGHPDVAQAYGIYAGSPMLRDDVRNGFPFAGMIFEEYVGNVGGIPFIPANEAYAFPVGVPNLFRTVYAPAGFVETVNTVGLPRYARSEPTRYNKGVDILTESNPFSFCSRPKCLVKLTTST